MVQTYPTEPDDLRVGSPLARLKLISDGFTVRLAAAEADLARLEARRDTAAAFVDNAGEDSDFVAVAGAMAERDTLARVMGKRRAELDTLERVTTEAGQAWASAWGRYSVLLKVLQEDDPARREFAAGELGKMI